jgi:hypothetical protein
LGRGKFGQKKRATGGQGPFRCEGYKTSRGEQLLRWYWEEKDHHLHQLNWIWESPGKVSMPRGKKYCNHRDVLEIWAKKEGHKKNLGPL